jgi:hypothetical protein
VASLVTVGKSRGAIVIYEHVSVSGEVRAPFAASKPYATRGASVTSPPRRGQSTRRNEARLRPTSTLMVTIGRHTPFKDTAATTQLPPTSSSTRVLLLTSTGINY